MKSIKETANYALQFAVEKGILKENTYFGNFKELEKYDRSLFKDIQLEHETLRDMLISAYHFGFLNNRQEIDELECRILNTVKYWASKDVFDWDFDEEKGISIPYTLQNLLSWCSQIKGEEEDKDVIRENIINPSLEKEKRHNCKFYILSYLFDCDVIGTRPPTGEQKKIKEIGKKRLKGVWDSGTFARIFNDIETHPRNSPMELSNTFGDDWKEIIIELSENPEELRNYLINRGF
jgi:hypothetical protein